MKVLVIGSGGREHALAWAFSKSPLLTKLYAAPGNAGIAALAECLPIAVDDIDGLVKAAKDHAIDFVMVGPETPLVLGVVDKLAAAGIKTFGPMKAAAQIEGSKGYMKDLCQRAGVPTAHYARFTDVEKARAHVQEKGAPIVIKTDGLAAGKGVTVAMTLQDALHAIDDAMVGQNFGAAGAELVIEEYMEGEEVSFFALVDGKTAIPFASAQDHKRAYDGDKGPNTGGMGAYSPAPVFTPAMQDDVMRRIIQPTIDKMAEEGTPYRGILFAGLMLTKTGPRLIEYNARFGDPETQCMVPRLKSDMLDALVKIADGKISEVKLEWQDHAALCVVMAANGYPGAYRKNTPIGGLEKAAGVEDAIVFHAGTVKKDGQIVSYGGRVLGITGFAPTVRQAYANAYKAVDCIDWPEGFCRKDIGKAAMT